MALVAFLLSTVATPAPCISQGSPVVPASSESPPGPGADLHDTADLRNTADLRDTARNGDTPAARSPSSEGATATGASPGWERSRRSGWIGVVLSLERVSVAARIDGVLESVEVRAGDEVNQGDLLAEIEDHDTLQNLEIARAELAVAEAALEHRRVRARRERSRFERRSTTSDLWSEEELASSEVEVKAAEADAQGAAAEVERAQALVEQLSRRLDSLQIRAPFAGQIAQRYLDPGAVVRAGTPIVRLVTGAARLVRFAVPPAEVRRLEEGSRVTVLDTSESILGVARVRHIAPEIDLASQQIFVEAILEEPTLVRQLRSGLGVVVRPEEKVQSSTVSQ